MALPPLPPRIKYPRTRKPSYYSGSPLEGGQRTAPPPPSAAEYLTGLGAGALAGGSLGFVPPIDPSVGGGRRRGRGGRGGRGGGVRETSWTEGGQYAVEGAPEWWIGKVPTGKVLTPNAAYASIVNSMIPYLSPEDQRTAANSLARTLPDIFGGYGDVSFGGPPLEVTPTMRRQFTSAKRAEGLLSALESMKEASDFKEESFGPGFTYFETLAKTMRDFGGTEESPMSRAQTKGLRAALDPLLAETKSSALSSFGPIAQSVSQPFFSAGDILPVTRLPSGEFIFGERNPEFF